MESIPTTAATYIRREAAIITRRSWCGSDHGRAVPAPVQAPTLSLAACWAVAGEGCRPRDLTAAQAAHVAEVIDTIEAHLGMSCSEFERRYAAMPADQVAQELRIIAWRVDQDLRQAMR